MPKRVEDILPGNRRSIRDIPINSHDVRPRRSAESDTAGAMTINIRKVPIAPPPKSIPPVKIARRSRRSAYFYIGLIVVLLILGGYAASIYFARAIFTMTPREIPITIDNVYTASAVPGNSPLVYKLVSISRTASTTVPATGGERVETKAQGTATFYNAYSAQPWQLIAGTRLSGDNGKIYRLTQSITIPKLTRSSTGSVVPGTITATIIADKPGEEYNLTRDDSAGMFDIVAYANTSKYQTVYAKLASDIRGGFVGNRKVVSPSILASTTASLKARIISLLAFEIKDSVPTGHIIYDQGIIPSFEEPQTDTAGPDSAVVSVRATLYGIILEQDKLIAVLAGDDAVKSFGGMAFDAVGLDKLSLSIPNIKDFSPTKKNTLTIRLKGDMQLVGSIPIDELKERFAGISLSETKEIMMSLSPIIDLSKSSGQVVPPWSKIPLNRDRISILIKE